jgi:lipopolysaccharide export system protein LptA
VLALAVALATLATSPAPKTATPVKPAAVKPAPGPAAPTVDDRGLTTKDFKIETTDTHANLNTGDFTMPNKVKFLRPGTTVDGDSAHGNFKSSTVTITGHVVMHDDGRSGQAASVGARSNGGPSTLTCDELYVDSKLKQYICTGHMHYVQGSETATADAGRLDQMSHMLDLTGNVHLSNGSESLAGVTVHYNTVTHDVDTNGTPLVLTAPLKNDKPTAPPKSPKKK